MPDRTLPPGDYAYLASGNSLLPCVVFGQRGRWRTTVFAFEPFRGTRKRRVRTRDLLDLDTANRLIAFRNDPLALLHARGDAGELKAGDAAHGPKQEPSA
jgi:hypothetical protein